MAEKRHQAVCVAVRVRPLRPEIGEGGSAWSIESNTLVERGNPDIRFSFDHVFTAERTTRDIYDRCIAGPIVQSCMSGFNATVFAYGQTSSGKSYTMLGEGSSPGIVPLAVQDMFTTINEQQGDGKEYVIKCSMLEIYNEQLRDLLAPPTAAAPANLRIVKSPLRGVYVDGAIRRPVTSTRQFIDYIHKEAEARRVSATHSMNERSSRSHCIVRLDVECWEKVDSEVAGSSAALSASVDARTGLPLAQEGDSIKVSALHLVDLAGSERISKTNATGQRKAEGANINKSLLFLGTVIEKLADPDSKGKHVPYRDSLLTRMLETSLGGNSLTCVVAAITEAEVHLEETRSTLQFASRASRVRNVVHRNEVSDDKTRARKLEAELKSAKLSLVAKTFKVWALQLRMKKVALAGPRGDAQAEKMVAALQESNAHLQAQVSSLHGDLQSAGDRESAADASKRNARLQILQQRIEEAEEDARSLQESHDTLETLCRELEEDNDQKLRKIDKLRKDKKAADAANDALKAECFALQDKLQASEHTARELARTRDDDISRARQATDADLQREAAEGRKEVSDLRAKHAALLEEVGKLKADSARAAEKTRAELSDREADGAKVTADLRQQVGYLRRLLQLGTLVNPGLHDEPARKRELPSLQGQVALVKEREVIAVENAVRSFVTSRQAHAPAAAMREEPAAAPPTSQLKQLQNIRHADPKGLLSSIASTNSSLREGSAAVEDSGFADAAPVSIKGMGEDGERRATRRRRLPGASSGDTTISSDPGMGAGGSGGGGGGGVGVDVEKLVAPYQQRVAVLERTISERDSQRDILLDTKLKRMQDLVIRVHNNCLNLQGVVHRLADESRQLKDFIAMKKLNSKLPPNLTSPTPAAAELIEAACSKPIRDHPRWHNTTVR
ncbi:Kinesin-like protein KIN-7I [Diplonema papillatum]|nr:Kinesin-like protein KIN-7I [Diplonema papillatum]